jgi:mxaC protein
MSPVSSHGAGGSVNLYVEHPWVLVLAVLALLPCLSSGSVPAKYPWLRMIPQDRLSTGFGFVVRMVGGIAIAALVVALSGLHRGEQYAERVAEGAQIVITLDRSRSMNDTFAGDMPTRKGEASKAEAASRLLLDFITRSPDSVYGLVEFTSSPIYVLPLTTKLTAIRAAIKAAAREGLALTDIATPLAMSLGFFEGRAYRGSRVILLVSDGAAEIDEQVGIWLRDTFHQYNARLYWIYIRSKDSPGMFAKVGAENRVVGGVPEQELHRYFQSLDIPYTAYEADDPAALQRAVADMDELERWPLYTVEVLPRENLSGYFYLLSLIFIVALIIATAFEVKLWR